MNEKGPEFITPAIDKRLHRRARLVARVKCDELGRDDFLLTRDVSLGGMFISTKKPLPLDSEVGLSFSLGPGTPTLACKGKVVYSMQGLGMGIEFADLSGESRRSIEKFVDEVI